MAAVSAEEGAVKILIRSRIVNPLLLWADIGLNQTAETLTHLCRRRVRAPLIPLDHRTFLQ